MSYLRIGLVMVNAIAFVTLLVLSLRFQRREESARVRRLWLIVALASAALVVGSVQRLVLQATTLTWISDSTRFSVLEQWQVFQSLAVAVIAIAAFVTLKNLAGSMAVSERIARSILDRVGHVDPERLDLTRREKEVLATIGQGLVTDAELSNALHISTSTVQTHVKRLLRKTGLNRRQDLLAVAYLMETVDESP
jgi:DNA-binding CsgD family transcriptional regulator